MDGLLKEVERALDAQLYYLAIASALALPDVCAALASADGRTSPRQYKDWYNLWLSPKYPRITEDDIYCLRCGVLHQGRLGHAGMQYERVIFTIAPMGHNNLLGGPNATSTGPFALQLDATLFCRDIIDAVSKWHLSNIQNQTVVANLTRLVEYRPNGIAPFINGFAVIA